MAKVVKNDDSHKAIKQNILNSILEFGKSNLQKSSLNFLKNLNYTNELNALSSPTYQGLLQDYPGLQLDEEKAFVKDWKEIQVLYSYSPEESGGLFASGKKGLKVADAFLFIAIELKKKEYTRTQLISITRAINRPFQVPVIVIFRYDDKLTLSVIDRRQSKSKNPVKAVEHVLEKVSLVYDVNVTHPHRAHTEILSSLHRDLLAEQGKITHFVDLYTAWRRALDTKELNQKFYKDISNWFYWASEEVKLPIIPLYLRNSDKKKAEQEKINATQFLIRLLCRTIFAWFVKEKEGLIDPTLLELYDETDQIRILVNSESVKKFWEENSYYRGILQNIFFCSLNEKMNHPKGRGKKNYIAKNFIPDNFDYSLFDSIPYMNGGLFDRLEEDNYDESIDDKKIKIPNKLFYARKEDGYVFGSGNKEIPLEGLNRILSNYKFTVSENTSLEEEVALDPELLGLVFENLLGELGLDEGTATNKRKEFGSFYTHRKIISNMVNDSLRLYLHTKLKAREFSKEDLDLLNPLLYKNQFPEDKEELAHTIVEELERIKILDPACGSGAFPMGALLRIVELLKKVDSSNEVWIRLQVEKADAGLRKSLEKTLRAEPQDYVRKLGLIKNAIYGVDIQPIAVLITKLRFFITLLVDQGIDKNSPETNYGIEPLPNLDTKLLCGNTLKELRTQNLFDAGIFDRYKKNRIEYFHEPEEKRRNQLLKSLAEDLDSLYPKFGAELTGIEYKSEKDRKTANILHIQDWIRHSSLPAPFFSFALFFPEIATGGFDIVMGNPPYGGTKIEDAVQSDLGLGSKDPYGAFISRFLGNGIRSTPLVKDGILSFIVSDTFMTIKSHKPLREQILNHRIHKMIRVHPDTFKATVNTAIILIQKEEVADADKIKILSARIPKDQTVLMADLTNISIHEEHDRFLDILYRTQGDNDKPQISTESCAVYTYPQTLIATNSNYPFFVASPKLFALMNDVTNQEIIEGKNLPRIRYRCTINDKEIILYKLGDEYEGMGAGKKWKNAGLFKIVSGIKTGSNEKYLRILDDKAQKNLELVDLERVLSKKEIENLTEKEKSEGINDKKSFIPFEMGMPSDSDSGFLPCYYQEESKIVIDWSKKSVKSMREEGHSDLANAEFRFMKLDNQISFSATGIYAPTFRSSNAPIFLNKSSRLVFNDNFSQAKLLGILNSKIIKFFIKNFLNHGVDTEVDDLKKILFSLPDEEKISSLVSSIIEKQKQNPRYDYASNEQIEIDRLVYEAYGLNREDIAEVESWYARRYPKLVAAQREKRKDPNRIFTNLYCDESCHLLKDKQDFMVLGSISVPEEKAREVSLQIRDIKRKHKLSDYFEIKWTKVSPAKLDFYKEIVDLFLSEKDLHVKSLVSKKNLSSPQDDWYYNEYFELLKDSFDPSQRYNVFVDKKDTRGKERVDKLRSRLSDLSFDYTKSMIRKIQLIESRESSILQILDLLIGAVSHKLRYPNDKTGKSELISYIEGKTNYPLDKESSLSSDKFVIQRRTGV